jgi:hypothetical protein
MVICEYTSLITSSTTLSTYYNAYLVTPSADTTVTLPSVTSTGVSFKIRRGGANFGIKVTIATSGSDVIYYDGINNTTYPLNPLNYVELIYNGNGTWFLSKLIMSDPSISSGVITTNFIENSSSSYKTLSNSTYPISYSYHKFSTRGHPNYMAISVTHVNSSGSGNLQVLTGATIHMSLSIAISTAGTYEYYTNTIIAPFPTVDSIVEIRWNSTGASNYQLGLNSIYLY